MVWLRQHIAASPCLAQQETSTRLFLSRSRHKHSNSGDLVSFSIDRHTFLDSLFSFSATGAQLKLCGFSLPGAPLVGLKHFSSCPLQICSLVPCRAAHKKLSQPAKRSARGETSGVHRRFETVCPGKGRAISVQHQDGALSASGASKAPKLEVSKGSIWTGRAISPFSFSPSAQPPKPSSPPTTTSASACGSSLRLPSWMLH